MKTCNYEIRFTNEDGSATESVYLEGVTLEEAFNQVKIELLTLRPWFGQVCGFAVLPHGFAVTLTLMKATSQRFS